MKRELFAAALWCAAGLFVGTGSARGEDLVTLSGAIYRDVHPVRADPDGVTWRYEGGLIKIDFADCPDNVRRTYHYDPSKAQAFRETEAKIRQQADEQAQRDAQNHEAHQRARVQAALAQTTSQDGTNADGTMVFRRAMSPAASQATRETAARMEAEAERRTAAASAIPDAISLFPKLPAILGPRPVNPFMDTPNAKEFVASLHPSPTGASGNFLPTTLDANRTTVLDTPLYLTRSYYEDVDRAAAYARGVPPKSP